MTPLEATSLLAFYQTAALSNEDPFDLSQGRVFSISADGEVKFLIATGDIYLGLHVLPAAYEQLGDVPVIGVETCGWAAPVDGADVAERAPSEDPRRRRVRLVAVVNRTKDVASAMAFRDDAQEVMTNTSGEGSLSEALVRCMDRVILMQSLPKIDDK